MLALNDSQHAVSLAIDGAETHGNEDELRLAAAEGLQGAPVAQHDLARLDDEGKLLLLLAKRSTTSPGGRTDLGADRLGVVLGLLGGHCDGFGVSKKEKS